MVEATGSFMLTWNNGDTLNGTYDAAYCADGVEP